jgi:hypothetical protein
MGFWTFDVLCCWNSFFPSIMGFKLLAQYEIYRKHCKIHLLALWLIAVSIAISIGIKQASAFAVDGRVVKKENINLNQMTLFYQIQTQ